MFDNESIGLQSILEFLENSREESTKVCYKIWLAQIKIASKGSGAHESSRCYNGQQDHERFLWEQNRGWTQIARNGNAAPCYHCPCDELGA